MSIDFPTLLDSVDDIVWKTDEDGKIEYINSAVYRLLGYKPQDMIGSAAIFSDTTLPLGKMAEVEVVNRPGKPVRMETRRDIYFGPDRKPAGYYGVCRLLESADKSSDNEVCKELHERMQESEALLSHQSRLAQMGQLLSNVAHQWKQPLAEINALLLDMDNDFYHNKLDNKRFEWFFKQFEKITSFMGETIDSFEEFMTPSDNLELFDPSQTIFKALSLIESRLEKHGVEVETSINEQCMIVGSPKEFIHVLLVILNNAVDALQSRGTEGARIDILTRRTEFNEEAIFELFIKDNAGGIEPEAASRMFDPYFTTKFSSRGRGVGLYMAKMIVENRMQGRLELIDPIHSTFRLAFRVAA